MYVRNRKWANLACLNYECIKFVRSYYGRTMAAAICMDHRGECSCTFSSGTGVLGLMRAYQSHGYGRTKYWTAKEEKSFRHSVNC